VPALLRTFVARQTVQWHAEKREWQSAVLQCPVAMLNQKQERCTALRVRMAVAVVTSLLALFVFVDSLVEHDGIPYYFIWLTNWTGMLSAAYAILAAYAAYAGFYHGELNGLLPAPSSIPPPPSSSSDVPRYVHALWFTKASAPVAQCLITLMFWVLLYDGGGVRVSGVTAHGIIAAVLIIDHTLLNRITVSNLYDFCNLYVFGVTYVIFNVVYTLIPDLTDHDGNTYAYEILDWSGSPARAGVVFVATMAVIMPLCWAVVLGLTTLRDRTLFPLHPPPPSPPPPLLQHDQLTEAEANSAV